MTTRNHYPASLSKRSDFGRRRSPRHGLALGAVVTSAVLAFFSIVACGSLPQLAAGAATALSSTPTPAPKPALDLCALVPSGALEATDKVVSPYVFSEGGEVYQLYPYTACHASYGSGEIIVAIEQYKTPVNAQRVENYLLTCPADGLHMGYTCTAISLGDGGFEIDGSSDPTCEQIPLTHRLMWVRGCFIARVEINTRPITSAQVNQLQNWATSLDTQLQTLPTCP
jgi:hypothetical protein